MTISRTVARCAILCLTLGASAVMVQAQDDKQPPPKRRPAENKEAEHKESPRHNAPAQQNAPVQQQQQQQRPVERHIPPPQVQQREQQRTPPPMQQQQAPAVNQPVQRQNQDSPQRQDRPNRPPSVYQSVPNNPPANRPSNEPGRTFGGQPGGQPGRTFGGANPPAGRANEPSRAPGGFDARSGPRTYTTRTGDVVHRDSGGQIRQVRMNNGTVVYHPPNAPRRVEVVRPGGRIVVASAPGHGYVQRPVIINNTTIIKRTYIYNGVPQARIYRPRVYNGVTLAIYTPVRYYHPSFYVYAYNPWARPIVYTWGWSSRPWYGYYGGYFTPYPVYASPSLWLTDYLIAATLESAYEERMAARAAANNYNNYQDTQAAPLTPEVKQAIADEVRRQIDQERAQGQNMNSSGGQETNIFADNQPHVFVAGASLLVNSNMGECTVSEGDVLQMNYAPPPNSPSAEVIVLASHGRDCRKGSRVSVALQDLQEMYNQMLATIDRGMGDLQSRQGQGGLPSLPPNSTGTIDTAYAREAQPDSNVAGELTTVTQDADRAEEQAVSQVTDTTPPTLSLGMSLNEVKAIQGDPEKIVDLGSKKIYVYKDLKITFMDGKVSDIQ
ncbi:MAG: hypothetical protein JWP63_2401 [Candidatus Solibacter sp.]|nr:hypothetical protein [Candidatus Solibacter sp.]